MSVNEKEIENFNKINLILEGNYMGGCGSSIIVKKQILEAIKKYLNENRSDLNIEIKMKKCKADFCESDFLVILFIDFNEGIIVGTSDKSDNDNYYPHLENTLHQTRHEFVELIGSKIIKMIYNIK